MTIALSAAQADFDSHPIEGHARAAQEAGKQAYFSAPLISHIEDNLYMGGCLHNYQLPDEFAHVVSLYPWESYELGPNTDRIQIEMHDSGNVPSPATLLALAKYVNVCLDDGPTLVHCQAGLNRSGLVAARTLILRGYPPQKAIHVLRENRSLLVLCNQAFEQYLLTLEAGE